MFLALGCTVALAACNAALDVSGNEVYDAVGKLDLSARSGGVLAARAGGASGVTRLRSGVTYIGQNAEAAQSTTGTGVEAADAASTRGGSYQVAYEDAPIATVAKSIISDALGLGLSMDSRVDGRISLSSGRPLTKTQLLTAFENALRASNAALLKDGEGYRIVPASETTGVAPLDPSRDPEPGAGVSVLPIRYVSADTLVKLLDGFATKPGAIRFDATRNVLMIQGSSDERRKAMETALAFDQDWMKGQSVGIYPVSSAAPEIVITELQRILDAGEGGAYKGFLQFQPIARMNAVLVVARKPAALRAAALWISRLDRADSGASLSHVYHVKYGDARQLATLLNASLGGGAPSSDNQSATEPGADRFGLSSSGASSTSGSLDQSGGAQSGGAASPFRQPGTTNAQTTPFGALQGRSGGSGGSSGAFGAGGALGGSDFGQSTSRSGATSGSDSGGGSAGGGGGAKARITADTSTNSLLIYADRQTYKLVESALRQLDRPRLQVAIEATIAEVTLTDDLQYGVQYYLQNSKGSVGLTTQATSAVLSQVLPGANFILGPQANPRVVLSALSSKTHVKVLSNPSIVVLDNQVGTIQVGDQVPVATTQATLVGTTNTGLNGSAIPVANNIDYRNTGIILRVLPRVSANGNVTLQIEQEISNVAGNGSQNTLTPTISQRHIRSSVDVASGQTVVLGGLISNSQTNGREGVPLLSSLSFIGDLFATNQSALNRTELVMFIRPQIIADAVDAQTVAEEMRSKMLYQRPFRK